MLAITCGSWIDIAMWWMKDQHRHREGHEPDCDRDRQVRNEVPARTRGTDRDQHERRVHERAERELRATVANESAKYPRPELRGGERQRHGRDREDYAHDRDHRRGQRREDLTRRVGGAEHHPRRKSQSAAERGLIERVRPEVQPDREDHLDAGHQPQVGPERSAAPLRAQSEERNHGKLSND